MQVVVRYEPLIALMINANAMVPAVFYEKDIVRCRRSVKELYFQERGFAPFLNRVQERDQTLASKTDSST